MKMWISVDERLPIDGPDEMEMQYEEVEVIATDGVDVFCCSFQFGKLLGFGPKPLMQPTGCHYQSRRR